ncbi:MAG: redoxin domain-containing protein [Caldithrix sp.]|nr:redoxin domain-containing protein [Caldithrix sp.]
MGIWSKSMLRRPFAFMQRGGPMAKKIKSLYIWVFMVSLTFSVAGQDKPYGVVPLQKGLPDLGTTVGRYEQPYHGEIASNDLFHALYFVKDRSDDDHKFSLFICYDDTLSLTVTSTSLQHKNGTYHDTVIITLKDENRHLIPLELYYHKDKNELKYHWVHSQKSDRQNPGGYPHLIDPKVMIGSLAPDFKVTTQSGDKIRLSSLRGKNVFLEFWGTWCGGCIMELPNVVRLREKYPKEELYILGLAFYDTQQELEAFLEEKPLNFPNALIDTSIVKAYGVRGFPSSFLIDTTGRVIAKKLRGKRLFEKVKTKIDNQR